MGRGEIISHLGDGLYSVKLLLQRGRVNNELSILAAKISELETQIAALDDGPEKSAKKLLKASYEKRVQYLNDNVSDDPTVSAWCADYNLTLSAGECGTIEVPGERVDVPVIIKPAGTLGDQAGYDINEDGFLQPVLGSTPSATFYNLAMMPGWQKWKPTFRLGEITAKAGDICSVAIDPATFSDRGSGLSANLNVNQDTDAGLVTLANVPIEYMNCNGVAFEVGDRVVVKFTDQDWSQPVVIGFEDNPKPCALGVLVIKITGEYYAGTFPTFDGGHAIEEVYTVWNTGIDTTLQVPKTGGGFWSYPLSATDYFGDFQTDLDAMFGDGKAIGAPQPLFTVTGYTSDMEIRSDSSRRGSPNSVHDVLEHQDDNDYMVVSVDNPYSFSDVFYEPYTPEKVLAARVQAYNRLSNREGYDLPLDNPYNYTEGDGAVANPIVGNDTWTEVAYHLYNEQRDYTPWGVDLGGGVIGSPADGQPDGGGLKIPGYYFWPGTGTMTHEGTHDITLSAPIGGVSTSDFFIGYVPAFIGRENKMPPPFTASTKILERDGVNTVAFGPAVTWSGSRTFSDGHIHTDPPTPWDIVSSFSLSESGDGSVTFSDSSGAYISASFEEIGVVTQTQNDGIAYHWPDYEPTKNVDYVNSDSDVSHGYGQSENWQAVLVIDTIETGTAETVLSAPVGPPWMYAETYPYYLYQPTESDAIVVNRSVRYHIATGRCAVVDNSYTDNPWDLPENGDFKSAIISAINHFLSANPLDDNDDRWVIKSEMNHLTW